MTFLRFATALLAVSLIAVVPLACGSDNSPAACEALATSAGERLATVQDGFLACHVDDDCGNTPVGEDGWCAAPCGGLTNQASAASFVSAAAMECGAFNARGCTPPELTCPAFGQKICAKGTCALYTTYLTPTMPALANGACATFEVHYATESPENNASADAPRDIDVSLMAYGGTLYADTACRTPLTAGSVTIASGSPVIAFGFLPDEASGYVDANGTTYSFTTK